MSNHYVSNHCSSRVLGLTQPKLGAIIRQNVVVGEEYTLKTAEKEDGKKVTTRKQKVRCVGVYPYTVCFKNRRGMTFSLAYIDVYNMLQGRTIKM